MILERSLRSDRFVSCNLMEVLSPSELDVEIFELLDEVWECLPSWSEKLSSKTRWNWGDIVPKSSNQHGKVLCIFICKWPDLRSNHCGSMTLWMEEDGSCFWRETLKMAINGAILMIRPHFAELSSLSSLLNSISKTALRKMTIIISIWSDSYSTRFGKTFKNMFCLQRLITVQWRFLETSSWIPNGGRRNMLHHRSSHYYTVQTT